MPSLIGVFVGRIGHYVCFDVLRLISYRRMFRGGGSFSAAPLGKKNKKKAARKSASFGAACVENLESLGAVKAEKWEAIPWHIPVLPFYVTTPPLPPPRPPPHFRIQLFFYFSQMRILEMFASSLISLSLSLSLSLHK